jgi:hypothetical protein
MMKCSFSSFLFLSNYFSTVTAIPVENSFSKTEILIVMRSTKNNLKSRVQLALDTWSPKALAQVNLEDNFITTSFFDKPTGVAQKQPLEPRFNQA